MLRPLVYSENAVGVCRRGDDRHRPAERGKLACQIVGPAQMAGQDRHRKASAFVQHDHGGVAGFALAIRGNGPHCNADGSHKYQGIRADKLRRCPLG